jgi:hypothetical protein
MAFALQCAWEDRIFDIHLQLDIQRCRTSRIHMRMCVQHRHTTNSNGNQVCPVFCSESALRSSVTKTAQLIVLQPARSALTMPGETLALSITTEKCTVVCWRHSVTCRRPPSLPCMVGFCAFRIVFTFWWDAILELFTRFLFEKSWKWNAVCSIYFSKWLWLWGCEMKPVRIDPDRWSKWEPLTVLLEVFVPPRLNRQRLSLPPGFSFLMHSRTLQCMRGV